jgi:hypothetical protein
MMVLLNEHLEEGEEAKRLKGRLIEEYPDSECIEAMQYKAASHTILYG